MPEVVYVDVNEPKEYLKGVIDIYGTENVILDNLKQRGGDYARGGIAIERKAGDLYESVVTGRLWEQAEKMRSNYEEVYVLYVEDEDRSMQFIRRDQRKKAYFAKRAAYWTLHKFGACMMPVADKNEFLWALKCIFDYGAKDHARPSQIVRKGRNMDECREDALRCIPGIGSKKAKALLNRYHSISNVFFTDSNTIEETIGKASARQLADFLIGEYGNRNNTAKNK